MKMDILEMVNSMSIYFQLFLASFFWGSNVIVMKLLLNQLPFLFLAFLRVLLSFLFLGLYICFTHIPLHCPNKKKLIIIALLSIYLNFYFTFLGMNQVKGVDNAFMNALSPTVTFLLSFLFLRNHYTFKEWIAMFLSLFAFLLSIHFQIFSIQIGFFYLLLGMILYISGNILIQKWNISHSISFTFFELLFGSLFLLGHCLLDGQLRFYQLSSLNLWDWILFLIISSLGFAFIQITYMKAIQQIGAVQTSFFLSLNPVFTYIESLIFLNESFDLMHFISFLLLMLSLIMIQKKKTS